MNDDMLDEFGIYSMYLACKLHYSSDSYDAMKYRFKTSAKPNNFWKRKDKYFFHKIGKRLNFNRDNILNYFNAYFIEDVTWVGKMLESEDIWKSYEKRMQSFQYIYENDINKLRDDAELEFDELFKIQDGTSHPPIIQMLLQGEICIETVVVLNKLLGFIPRMKITETLVWPDLKRKLIKYGIMIDQKINTDNFKKITLKVFTN